LRAAGADGASEEWRRGETYVRGFWRDAGREEAVAQATAALRGLLDVGLLDALPALDVSAMEDQDWLEGWKQFFSPLAIAPNLAIAPSWEPFVPEPGQAVVILDPGMAFGTGTHGTTYTCLQALAAHLRTGQAVADIGCGSGILAIAAAKLGAGRIVATDNDPLAVRVAGENAAMNGVADRIDLRVADLLEDVDGPFDIMLANILAPVVLALIPQLPRVLAPGGLLISSGYILIQEDDIRAGLVAAGHTVVDRYAREGWVTLVSRAPCRG
jgi:ribosomal protein L11 methyltransferase